MESKSETDVQVIEAEYDDGGVYFYQAYNDEIAEWAVENQILGGPPYNPQRMTWIKPSFAWVLYRSGYARKHNQTRILKIKLSHQSVSELLSECNCGKGGGGSYGRVQWDPARDLLSSHDKEPRKMLRKRAIQIGLKGHLNQLYVSRIISVEDVTDLAHKVEEAHLSKDCEKMMENLICELPSERSYAPACSDEVLENLGLKEGDVSKAIARLGFGKTS